MAQTTAAPSTRERLIGRGWVQGAVLITLFGFFVLVLIGYQAYQSGPPIPHRTVTAGGQTVYTEADVRAGQDVFLQNGLMEYGSIFGHGGYLGPDYTADYLHRSAQIVQRSYGNGGDAVERTRNEFKKNTYDKTTGTLVVSDAIALIATATSAALARAFTRGHRARRGTPPVEAPDQVPKTWNSQSE